MTGRGALRWLRALTLASVTLASGVMGHLASGGQAPSRSALLALLVVSTAALAPWLGSLATTRRVVTLSALGQVLLHLVLEGVPGSLSPHGAAHAMAGHAAGHVAPSHLPTTGMALAHALAATVVAVWLAAGERAVRHAMLLALRPVRRVWRGLRDLAAVGLRLRRSCDQERWGYVGGNRPWSWTGRRVSPRGPPRRLVA